MILRALLLLLRPLLRLFDTAKSAKRAAKTSARGPAHPWVRAARTAIAPPERELARPVRPPLPPHLAALLAAAPAIEPDLAPRPRPPLLQPFRSIAAHVRIYNPKPPAPDARRAEPTILASWADRLAAAVSRFGSLLAQDGPPRALGL